MTSSLRSKPGSIDEGIICPCVPAARALLATVVALGGLVMGRRRVLGGLLLLLVLSAAVWAESQDYYSLLKVNREATTREIRQAFKKLALTMHPDKNPVSPSERPHTTSTTLRVPSDTHVHPVKNHKPLHPDER